MSNTGDWLPILPADLDSVNRLADSIHTTLPERPEVFEEKVRLFPKGCKKFVLNGNMVGYGISHPWMLNTIPPLNKFLKNLPEKPECLYLHDIVIAPGARGMGAAGRYVDYIKQLAVEISIPSLALVSVYGTDVLWSRFGFRTVQNSDLNRKLISYGTTAKYMICDLK
ncbi:MAG: GNAT family N-acetyltransferase [Limisphaerales bacterium]